MSVRLSLSGMFETRIAEIVVVQTTQRRERKRQMAEYEYVIRHVT